MAREVTQSCWDNDCSGFISLPVTIPKYFDELTTATGYIGEYPPNKESSRLEIIPDPKEIMRSVQDVLEQRKCK